MKKHVGRLAMKTPAPQTAKKLGKADPTGYFHPLAVVCDSGLASIMIDRRSLFSECASQIPQSASPHCL